MLNTAMRPGEVAKLRLRDIDQENGCVTIRDTKTKQPRVLAINRDIISEIASTTPYFDDYLFMRIKNLESVYISNNPSVIFQQAFKKIRRSMAAWHADQVAAGKATGEWIDFTLHDLRHTAASHLLAMGTDIRIIANILGHRSLSMVMRYTHLSQKTTREHLDKLSILTQEED